VGLGVVPAAAAAHRAADRGRRGGAVLGERPGAPGGAAAVGRGGAAAVLPAASAHSGHREEHLRAPASRDLGLRFGIGGVARAAPQGLGAGQGGARRDAGGSGGLADAGERDREREEVVGASQVGAEAGGDGGHLLGFLVLAPLPSPSLALVLVRCGGRVRARLPRKKNVFLYLGSASCAWASGDRQRRMAVSLEGCGLSFNKSFMGWAFENSWPALP
jgi:hypothetical protein